MGDYIYINWSPENQRIPNVSRIAGVAQQQSNSCIKLGAKYLLTLISYSELSTKAKQENIKKRKRLKNITKTKIKILHIY